MKHTKKMIMVPETEYFALLNMIKGGDYLQSEKASINAEIYKNLNDQTIPENLKSIKHNFLVKQRRQIKEIIENKPQKVIIDQIPNLPSIAPYLGITKPPNASIINEEINATPKEIRKTPRRKIPRKSVSITDSSGEVTNGGTEKTDDIDSEESESDFETPKSSETIYGTPLINPNLRKQLKDYVEQYKDELRISAKGKIYDYRNNTIKNSDYNQILDYLTGRIKDKPTGTKFLKDRLMKNTFIKQMINYSSPMSGKGKRVLVKLKSIKTPGLIRHEKIIKFKPTIWAKI